MANEGMRSAWDGEEGEHWAEYADRYDASSERVKAAYIPAIGAGADDRVLDIGCGAGVLALELAGRVASITGVDLSSRMLDVARRRAAERGIANATFEHADAQTDPLGAGYDVAVSSFGVMFFDDPVAAFTNIGRALKPGGRVSFLVWRPITENQWLMGIRTSMAMGRELPLPPLDAPNPFTLSVPERTASLFQAAGYTGVTSTPVDEPMVLGSDVENAYAFFSQAGLAKGLSQDLSEEDRAQGFANLKRFLAAYETPEGVVVPSAAWVIGATRG
ncbi:MAG: hypothetical protein QOK28_3800 [Actinomycetota bacterium]|jgi:SAM-dependent methyltransferase